MKAHKQIMEFVQCICGNELGVGAHSIKCKKCDGSYKFLGDKNGVVFEVVYHPKDLGKKPLDFGSERRGSRNNWREKNYFLTADWIENLSSSDVLLDLGSGPLTNSPLFRNLDTVIYVDGAQFEGINIVCDFTKFLPVKDSSIDAILCSNVLEHLPEPQTVFNEIERILKPGGQCLVLVPFMIKLHQEPYDFHRYTKHALKRYSERSGLNVDQIEEVGGISNILGTIYSVAIKEQLSWGGLFSLRLQYLIWRVMRRFIGDEGPSQVMPQGYALYLSKSLK